MKTSLLVLTSLGLPIAKAWTFSLPFAAPQAGQIRKVEPGTIFDLKLSIGREENRPTTLPASWAKDSRIVLSSIKVCTNNEDGKKDANLISMPGRDGPTPQCSSGSAPLDILGSLPHFVGERGQEPVRLESGTWETVFRKDAPAGQLIIGFSCPDGAERNDASIPPGNVYIQFALWDRSELNQYKAKVDESMKLARGFVKDRNKAIEEMHEADNFVMKALKYREACVAMEKINFSSAASMASKLPEKVVDLEGGLSVATLGTVWCKDMNMRGGKHALLGHCTIQGDEASVGTV